MDGYRSVITPCTANLLMMADSRLSVEDGCSSLHAVPGSTSVSTRLAKRSIINRARACGVYGLRSHFSGAKYMNPLRWVALFACLIFLTVCQDARANIYSSPVQAYQNCVAPMQSLEAEYSPSDYIMWTQCAPGVDPQSGDQYGMHGYHYSGVITNPSYVAYNRPFDSWPSVYRQSSSNFNAVKNLGCGCQRSVMRPLVGNPINVATGNKYEEQTDFSQGDLAFVRYYNSDASARTATLGTKWLSSYDRSLYFFPITYNSSSEVEAPTQMTVQRPDGQELTYNKTNGAWVSGSGSDVDDVLTEVDNADGSVASWQLFVADARQYESYSATGQLQSISDESHVLMTLTYENVTTAQAASWGAPPTELLSSVTDAYGRSLTFQYNSALQISAITLPDGGAVQYTYDPGTLLLTSVTYPDGKTRQYTYDESAYSAAGANMGKLTGIVDESGSRYGTYGYDANGLGNLTEHGAGADLYTMNYAVNLRTSIAYPLGNGAFANIAAPQGTAMIASMSTSCGNDCGQQYQSQTVDANGYPATATDFNGNITATTYDSTGLLDVEVDAQGTSSQRTTTTTWNTTLRVPLARTVSNAGGTIVSSTQWVYNSGGQTLARCDIDPTNSAASGYSCSNTGTVPAGVRRSTYTYCTAVDTVQCPIVGLLLTATGPRTDLTQTTTYSYYMSSSAVNCGTPGAACYQPGDLHTVTDALGHVTTIASYDADGRVTRLTDANGVNTDLTYTPRGWLASRTVGGATTSFTYMPYGAVQTVTDPDGVTTTYGYDTAHRLTTITDALGNYVQYTLDAAGDKTGENVYDSTGTSRKQLTRKFNTLGQLTTVIDGLNTTVFNASASGSYDANGNLIQSSDGLGIQRQLGYDALNRLVQTLDNYNGTDTATQNTKTAYQYDSLNRLTQVTDPSSLNTTYSYDGLSDATGQVSPDTGTTSRTFDAAGNVLTKTDAKGITSTITYDALNRPLTVSYPDNTQNISYTYDEANSVTGCSSSSPTGRLTRIIENSVTTVYCYDAWGRVTQKQKITAAATNTVGYSYTAAGRLSSAVYSDGAMVSYVRDGDGRIQSVSTTPANGTATSVVSGVTYQPFGPISGYTLGNGQVITRAVDANYRLTDLTSPAFTLHLARDAMGDITAIGNAAGANPATETYSYDPLYRLTAITEASGSVLESVTYNPTGDRLSKTGSGLDTGAYGYNPNTHQLVTIGTSALTVDADGNTTAISQAGSAYGFGYNDRNRMTVAQLAGSTIANYTYDALGQRIQKVANGQTESYVYNEAGKLLAEYGATNRDYIWMGGIQVANIDASNGSSTITYVTADQLGTPRAIADANGNTLWQLPYQGNPWAEQSPTSNGYTYNLRFAGQYFDQETGLYYNIDRYLIAADGRYGQSDRLGVFGKQSSTYAYANNNPLALIDPSGLQEYDPAEDLPDETEAYVLRPLLGPNQIPQNSYQEEMDEGECRAPWNKKPVIYIDPADIAGLRPKEIDDLARRLGLIPKGPDPMNGRGAYLDPETGQQRILSHPDAEPPHAHVNDPSGQRLDINGNPVPAESPAAHLPIGN
jgi:RHS repeat-associated protein